MTRDELLGEIEKATPIIQRYIAWLEVQGMLPPPDAENEPAETVYGGLVPQDRERMCAVGMDHLAGGVALGLFVRGVEAHRAVLDPETADAIGRALRIVAKQYRSQQQRAN